MHNVHIILDVMHINGKGGHLSVLVVDDDRYIPQLIHKIISEAHPAISFTSFSLPSEAIEWTRTNAVDVAFVDYQLPEMDGLSTINELKKYAPHLFSIVITAHSDISIAIEGIRRGVFDFLQKPINQDLLTLCMERVLSQIRLVQENELLHELLKKQNILLGNSPHMTAIKEKIAIFSSSNSPVLITGETGVGKEMVARHLHMAGKNKNAPFVAISCASLPFSLFESELFGYEKGAFSGADKQNIGKLEFAGNGTVLLDEVGEIPLEIQVKLLRVLQEREFQRLGGNRSVKLKARIIAATNRDIHSAVIEGTFRKDFYYRLNVLHIDIPPLRHRKEDIEIIAEHFRKKSCLNYEKDVSFSRQVLDLMKEHPWPGNVRQLQNVVENVVLSANSKTIEMMHLPQDFIQTQFARTYHLPGTTSVSEKNKRKRGISQEEILLSLERHAGNKSKTALELGVTRAQLLYRMKKLQIE